MKKMKRPFTRLVAGYLVLAMYVMGMAPRVHAGMVSSEITPSPGVERIADLAKIQKVMETKIVTMRNLLNVTNKFEIMLDFPNGMFYKSNILQE